MVDMGRAMPSDREGKACPIEKAGTKAALDRCRMLADRIASDLREKKPEHFFNTVSLAEFKASLERAVSVLEQNRRPSPRSLPNHRT